MITEAEGGFIGICLEGFLFGKMISILRASALTCNTHAREVTVQLFIIIDYSPV